MIETKQ